MTFESNQYLTFAIGGEDYALGVLRVKEIIEYSEITEVPEMPSWVRGVINLRGLGVPVVDLSVKFGGLRQPVNKRTCIVIAETSLAVSEPLIGLVVDSVSQVVEFGGKDIQPAPAFGTAARADYLAGMAESGRKFVLLLDVDRVLTEEEFEAATTIDASDRGLVVA